MSNRQNIQILFCVFFLLVSILALPIRADERPKIGLALSGGGAMGLAHIGVLKTIDSLNIPIDYIVGTSMGGIVGALYATHHTGKEIEQIALQTQWTRLFSDRPAKEAMPFYRKRTWRNYQLELDLKNFQPVTSGLIRGQNIQMKFISLVSEYLAVRDFSQLPVPFSCIAVDLRSGEEVVLDRGFLPKAMRATMSIPSVFSPVPWDDQLLIDGGLLNNLPTDVVREMGADIIIASAVSNPTSSKENISSIIDVVTQSFHIARNSQINTKAELADIVIQTDLPGYSSADFSPQKVRGILKRGDMSARKNLQKLIPLAEKAKGVQQRMISSPRIEKISVYGNLTPVPDSTKNLLQHMNGMPSNSIDSLIMVLEQSHGLQVNEYETISVSDSTQLVKMYLQHVTPPIITEISLYGNRALSDEFIYEALSIEPGDQYDMSRLGNKINSLYSLGYFEKISFQPEIVSRHEVQVDIFIREQSFQTLQLGLHYNDHYKLIPSAKFDWDNILLSGVRLESDLRIMGVTQVDLEISYHPQEVMFSFYPYIQVQYSDVPSNIYTARGHRITTFQNRKTSLSLGAGGSFRKNIHTRIGLTTERLAISPDLILNYPNQTIIPPTRQNTRLFAFSGTLDFLDNYLVPTRGILAEIQYLNSNRAYLDSPIEYTRFRTEVDLYRPLGKRHFTHLKYVFAKAFDQLPLQQHFFIGGPASFIGIQYEQLVTSEFSYIRGDYSYRMFPKSLVKLIGNYGFGYRTYPDNRFISRGIFGFGIAFQYNSFMGPAILTIARGPLDLLVKESLQTVGYLTVGYRF